MLEGKTNKEEGKRVVWGDEKPYFGLRLTVLPETTTKTTAPATAKKKKKAKENNRRNKTRQTKGK